MPQEYDSLMSNGRWELVDLPEGRAVVNSMWNFKIKSDLAGDVFPFKARFVAKGTANAILHKDVLTCHRNG
jgi:hypothetical protein